MSFQKSIRFVKLIRSPSFLIAVAVVSLAGVCHTSFAQKEPTDVIKVNTDLVVFDAQVIDKKSKRVIGDLTKDDFEITENGVKQSVSYFSRDELPLSIMLMLDVSGSVRPILHQIRDGALNALQRLKPEDQVAVMAFGTTYELAQDFTKDRALVSKKIESATANDLIVRAAIGKVFNVMFLGTIHGVNHFVEQTGGEILGASKNEVDAKLAVVIDRLRARYALGFRPTNSSDDGKFRPIEIKISAVKKRKEKLVVLTKRGYYLRRRSS